MSKHVKVRLIGVTDHIIEKAYNIDMETSLDNVLRETMKDNTDLIEKLFELLLNGRYLLIINGLSVHRFSDVKSIRVNPGDEIAIMPVVFGGCREI
jgi:molybdopterin converting factor small subunit